MATGGIGLANKLTLLRIAAAPALVVAFLFPGQDGELLRVAILLAAGATDFLDGRLARARGEVSRMGAVLDPAADKALVLCALLMLAGTGALSLGGLLAAAIIVFREALVSGLREGVDGSGETVTSSMTAKWKTAAQFAALAILLGGSISAQIHPALPRVGESLLWVAAGLALVSGSVYAWNFWRNARR